jgi:hypothetical protein
MVLEVVCVHHIGLSSLEPTRSLVEVRPVCEVAVVAYPGVAVGAAPTSGVVGASSHHHGQRRLHDGGRTCGGCPWRGGCLAD